MIEYFVQTYGVKIRGSKGAFEGFSWKDSPFGALDDSKKAIQGLGGEITRLMNNASLSRKEQSDRIDELRLQIEGMQDNARREFLDALPALKRWAVRASNLAALAPVFGAGSPSQDHWSL